MDVSDDRRMDTAPEPTPHVAIVVYPGVQSLDVTGPLEVFPGAQRLVEAERSP